MKFMLLPVGARFEFQGEAYTKSSPVIASRDSTGEGRMIPRSAVVRPLAEGEPAETVTLPEHVSFETVQGALETLHKECTRCLDDLDKDLSGAVKGEVRERLERAFSQARQGLSAQDSLPDTAAS